MTEAGVPDFVVTFWAAYVMPTATPPSIVDTIATTHKDVAAEEATQKRFLTAVRVSSPARQPRPQPSPPRKPQCRWCAFRG
jgi:tripartite-type tricarboxylate transporter receptor subunit TctC